MVLKMHTLGRDLAEACEREDLKTAGVGEDRAVPPHEAVKAAHLADELVTRAKVEVVSVAGSIAYEKVALGETSSATPLAPGAGVRAVIVGGVVSPPPLPHSIRASAQSAWS